MYSYRNTGYFITIIISLLVFNLQIQAQDDQNDIHVYTIGNLADLEPDMPQLEALVNKIEETKKQAVVLFSGDIIKSNLSKESLRDLDSIRLFNILKRLQSNYIQKLVFLPGDRDWAYSGKSGMINVRILESILESLPFDNIVWKPGHGCPGPKEIEIGENLLLVMINTQYWNHPFDVPSPTDAVCKISSQNDFLEDLEDIISETKNKNVLITGHFPVISSGEYGGSMSIKKHLFPLTDISPRLYLPLPLIGSFYPAFRQNIGSKMDISNENYREFNSHLKNLLKDHPGIIYVSGHDYIQQLIYTDKSYFINSGGYVKHEHMGRVEDELFNTNNLSLFRIEYENNGNITVTSLALEGIELREENSIVLFQSACSEKVTDTPLNEYFAPCNLNTIFPDKMSAKYNDPVLVEAGKEYKASGFKELFLGWHYRDTWTQSVQVHYLNLDTTFGGLIPIKRGGGRQTTSLKFRARNGCEYVFRSVNKDPKKALSYDLRETIIADVIKDQTTTQNPYGALGTKLMQEKLGILHPDPNLFVLPPDEKLGPFKDEYSNLFGMLEESPKGPRNGCPGFANSDDVFRSYKLFRTLYENHNNRVDQLSFAKAKVFDILVGDWGRHEDNWKWAKYENKNGNIYQPIPRDRDHVFSVWDGLFPWIADREWAKPSGDHFGYSVKDIRSLTWSARRLDRIMLTEISKDDWLMQVQFVQEMLTDSLIKASIKNMPPEVYDISGKEIEDKLIHRRDHLDEFILDYYNLLSKYVDVLGSGKKEMFYVTRNDDNSVDVLMTNKSGDVKLYERTFYPKETKEIRLFGLGNEDKFYISGESKKSILLRVIGGDGEDEIDDQSKVKGCSKKTLVYELDKESVIKGGKETKLIKTHNQSAYDYNRQAFAYNTYFPMPYMGYNADDGILIGLGVRFTRQRYGKEGYSSKHSLKVGGSTAGNMQFSYDGRLHHVFGKWDFIYHGLLAYPSDYVNFYGYGNETTKIDSLYAKDFYKTRYNSMQAGIGIVHNFWKQSEFGVSIQYENNEAQISKNTILDVKQDILGTEKINLYEVIALLDLDFRNEKKFPEKGMRFFGQFNQGLIANKDYISYNKFLGFIELHSTIPFKLPVYIGLKGGGALSSGEIPFYHLNNLGQNNFLRGYRKNRFTGKSMVFLNSDMKLQLLNIVTPVVPVKFGLRGFYDIGRVYAENENSDKLHAGYGGGIYLIPLEKSFSLGFNMAFSEEEKGGLIVFEFGISF